MTSVAETLGTGVSSIPGSALWAVAIAGTSGMLGAWLQHRYEPGWLPNMPAVGFAIVSPAAIAIKKFLGSLIGKLLERFRPGIGERFPVAAASGLIAGESMAGVLHALMGIAR